MNPVARVERTCLTCGAKFLFLPSPSREGRGKYCSKSCGTTAQHTRHGHTTKTTQSPTYTTYQSMVARCHNPSAPKYRAYGGQGIAVCQRWRDNFTAFLEDMGERPARTTIDRIDGSKGYEPGNCRWATIKTQQSNIASNVWIEFDGRRQIVADWARELGVHGKVITYRLAAGWPMEKALTHRPWGRPKTSVAPAAGA